MEVFLPRHDCVVSFLDQGASSRADHAFRNTPAAVVGAAVALTMEIPLDPEMEIRLDRRLVKSDRRMSYNPS
jgi:hypothetical protein